MEKILSRADTRVQVLEAIADSRSRHVFPEDLRPHIKKIVKSGKEKEIKALLGVYSKGYGFSKAPLLDSEDWTTLSQNAKENIRVATLSAFVQRLQNLDSYISKEVVDQILSFSDDSSDKVLAIFIPLLYAVAKTHYVDIDVTPLLTHKNNEVRYKAVALYLGYDLERESWSSPRNKPDLKKVAKLVSDSYNPISKLAEEYLDRAQSSRR
jgi:hypothetical protein